MRHTAITHLTGKQVGVRIVNKTARHEKLDTTEIYLHVEDDVWHDEVSGK